MIFSTIIMGTILYLMLVFFAEKFNYYESWKVVYLFIVVFVGLLSYFIVSNFSGGFKFRDIRLR